MGVLKKPPCNFRQEHLRTAPEQWIEVSETILVSERDDWYLGKY